MGSAPKGRHTTEKALLESGLANLTEITFKKWLNGLVEDSEYEKAKVKYSDALLAEQAERKTNRSFLETLDNSLRKGVLHRLSDFREPDPMKPITRGEKRVLKDIEVDGQACKQMCIKGPGNKGRIAIPRYWSTPKMHVQHTKHASRTKCNIM